jgi:hypothetical protein
MAEIPLSRRQLIQDACSGAMVVSVPSLVTPLLIGRSPPLSGEVRYVSPDGSDSNSGTSPDFPWDLATLQAADLPVDTTIRFLGDFYDAQLNPKSGLIYVAHGARRILSGAFNLKNAEWTNEGGGNWSTLITRTGGVGDGRTTALYRGDTQQWYLNNHRRQNPPIGRKTSPEECVNDGDWYHVAGAGPQKLYVHNSRGNPATDSQLPRLEYGNRLYTVNCPNVDDVTIDGIDFEGSNLAAIRGLDSHNIHLINVTFNGHREAGALLRISEDANGAPVREEGHYIFDDCNANWVGYRTEQSCQIFHNGGGAGQHGVRLLEINGGHFGPICGTDVVTNNGSTGFASGRRTTTIARSATFHNTFGENPWDSKTGEVEMYDCVLIGNGTVESPGALTCQLATSRLIARRTRFELYKQFFCASFTKGQSDQVGRLYDIQDCEFVKDYDGTAGTHETVHIVDINDTDARVIFKNNRIWGQLGNSSAATCLNVEGNYNYVIQNNEFIRRGAASHVRLPSPSNNITFSGNTTPDAGGLVIVGA